MQRTIRNLRREYSDSPLSEESISHNPIEQFGRWFRDAIRAKIREPHAMCLSTVDGSGQPHSRIVLMKYFGEDGFAFATSYLSQKAEDLSDNPQLALNFFWPDLERQVRITGRAKKAPKQLSDQFFNARPRGSKIAARLFAQSSVVPSRADIESKFRSMTAKFRGESIQRPPSWGAYLIIPNSFEFWQGRANRLHDRIRFRKSAGNMWIVERLAP